MDPSSSCSLRKQGSVIPLGIVLVHVVCNAVLLWSLSRTSPRCQSIQCQLRAVAVKKRTIKTFCSSLPLFHTCQMKNRHTLMLASTASLVDERKTSKAAVVARPNHHTTCGLMHKTPTNIKCCKLCFVPIAHIC